MPAGNISGKLNLNGAGWSSAVEQAKREIKSLQDASAKAGHGTVSSMQAASASIRLIEGDMTRNVRAVEKFITTIPGVGKALQAVFPIVGAAATVGIIARIGEEVYKLAHDFGQIRNIANEGFSAITEGAQKNADTLRVTNDKLEQQIATLEHKPVNNLALALDEARLRADDLATSLNKDYESVKKVIEESQKGFASKLFNGGIDSQLGGGMQDRLANMRTLARQQRDALKGGDQGSADDLAAKLRAAQDEALRFADSETKRRSGVANAGTVRQAPFASVYGNQGTNFDAINAFKDLVSGQEDTADQQKRNTADQEKVRALEQGNKASADLLKDMQEGMEKQKAMYGASVADQLAYWSARISAFSRGSEQFHTVQMEEYKLQADLFKELNEGKKKYLEAGKGTVEGNDMLDRGAAEFRKLEAEQIERSAKATKEYNEEVAKGNQEQEKSRTAFAETSIAIALAQGAISQLDAAQALAAIHAHDHAAELDLVNQKLAKQIELINAMPDDKMSAEDKLGATRNAQKSAENQISALNGGYAVTQARDQASVSGATIPGAVKDSLSQMVQSFTDMAAQLKVIIPQTIDNLNGDIAKAMTGHGSKADFGRTLTQAGQGLAKTGLQAAEGTALSWLTHGKLGGAKRDGSSQLAALWVQIAAGNAAIAGMGTQSPGVSATVGGLASLVPGGSFIQPFIKGAMNLLPHLANGGYVPPGQDFIAGEHGEELLNSGNTGTTVTPNGMLGGSHTHFHIDARGATDPSAVHAAIMRAAPAIITASSHTAHQRNMRSPHGR